MTLEVFTARVGCRDPDVFDITRSSGRGALAFAPSEAILWPAINARRTADKLRAEADAAEAREEGAGTVLRRNGEALEEQAWVDYEPRYLGEMRVSWGLAPARHGAFERLAVEHGVKADRRAWEALLARPRVVLTCFCTNPERCHRRLLARILAKLGAVDRGELPTAGAAPGPCAPAHRDAKPENLHPAHERPAVWALVRDFRVLFEEWADLA